MIGGYQESLFGGRITWQSLFDESSVQRHRLGTIRPLEDGRVFAYAKNGAAQLAAGNITVGAAPAANHRNIAVAANAAIGDRRVSVTLGATAAAKDLYKDGYLHVNDATGEGHLYKIRGHAAIGSSGTGWIELYDALRVALITTSEITLTKERQDGVIVHPAATAVLSGTPAGVAPRVITASYYFWNQVKGPCAILFTGTAVLGNLVVMDSTATTGIAGAVTVAADIAALLKGGPVGTVMQVNATTEFALINLNIPGY